jgi:hypothetical protein
MIMTAATLDVSETSEGMLQFIRTPLCENGSLILVQASQPLDD